ncbi:MAG: hypothetical protein Q4A58_05910 [Fusobacterium sp.]|uniref:lysine 5,6-aminomutase reactivase ATPase KamC n=1 Tax=Fusobacterium sp. TaxID=68766 RepID=UPI0026DCE5AB|nr:hypothetical protein [Fusobacterium sp.]MDO4690815.1 hypothetical protein [Fusobacterium sp.]
MKFIDENSINRLNFKDLLSRVEILSPYGKEKLNNLKIYLPGDEEELEGEFLQMEKIKEFILEEKKILMEIEIILHKLKDIKTLANCSLEDGILDVVDLYEIKAQAFMFEELNKLLKEKNEIFQNYILKDLSELIKILDPNDERISTFHIYESYSVILKEIRRQKKEVEKKLFIEKDYEKLKSLKEERLSILVDEEREEFKVRKGLSKLIKKFMPDFIENIKKSAELDLVLGKVKFANEYGGMRPEIVKNKKQIILKDAINLEVREYLNASNKKYTPISIMLNTGTTVITGANMGGKSVALKTIAENVLLFHMGFFTFSSEAKISLLNFLFFVSDDMQDISKGLSTFGAEIIKLKEVNKRLSQGSGLIIFDEFARGTNPKEGQKFVRALAKYLNLKESISVITTHFDAVITEGMKHYQVVGLKKINFDELKNRMLANNNSMELIQENMDFSLEESQSTEVPKDAYNIAKLIGLDEEISEMIYEEYTEED